MLRSCCLSNFFESRSAILEGKSKMSQPIMGHGGHLFYLSARKHRLGKGRWDLASCQVSSNSVQRFQRRSRKCLSQAEAGTAILFFRSAQKTQLFKLGRRCWDLASCQVSLNSVQRFQRRSWKCESLRTDDGRSNDGRCAMTIAHLSLWLRWAKK